MKKYFRLISASLLLVAVSWLLVKIPAIAQSNGLGVTPKQSFTMQAGQRATNSLYLNNLNTTQPLTVHINVVDFEAQGEGGAAKLLQASDQPQTPWSLKPYLTIGEFVTVPPGQSKQVPFTIRLPENIGAGTYYSAIEYTASTGSNQQQVNIAASSATLLFINVPGEVTELLTLQQFGMYKDGKFQSVFRSPPTSFAYRLKNSGNVAESPAASLVIKNIFGKRVANVSNANPKAQLALIGQTRRFEGCNPKSTEPDDIPRDDNCVPFNLSPGYYKAELVVLYGQNGQPTRQIGATSHFWYLPWSFIIKLLVGIAVVVAVVYWFIRRRR